MTSPRMNIPETPRHDGNPEAGTNKILKESVGIDTSPVDSVGGAKPEPEERPFFEERVLEANKVQLSTGELYAGAPPVVHIESTVAREIQAFGKQCGRCKHFSHVAGQAEIARIEQVGDPEDKHMLRELKAQLLETGVVDVMGEYVGHTEIFHDETNDFIHEMGACMFGTSHQGGDVQLLHPSQNACPTVFADGKPWPWAYEAKDSFVARQDALNYDQLMHGASVK